MIKLKLLLESLYITRDNVQQPPTMTESVGDVKFILTKTQYDALNKISQKFDGNLEGLLESNIQERETKNYISMTPEDMEAGNFVLSIDRKIMDGINEFIELGLDAKDWYTEMNKKIFEAFGDSDGCLLLILLAIFSPRNKLTSNLRLAAQTYCGIKIDVEQNREMLEEFISLTPADAYKRVKGGEFLDLKTVRGAKEGAVFFNVYLPNLIRVLRLYKSKNYTFTKNDVTRELSKHLTMTGALDKSSVISAEKVFSFTLNLLDPTFQFEDIGWLPTTIDTWMAAFFWPHLSKNEQLKAVSKTANYVYLAKLTQQLAAKFNMKPHEMQAILWVAMIRKKQGPNYDVTVNTSIIKNLKRLKIKSEEIHDISNFFDKVILAIGCVF